MELLKPPYDRNPKGFERILTRPVLPAMMLAILAATGCSIEKPEAPGWTVDLRIPIADRTFDLEYIVEHAAQDELVWDSIDGARIHVERALDPITVGGSLTLDDVQHTFSESLGVFDVAIDAAASAEVRLDEIYSGPLGLIASFSAEVSRNLTAIDGFTSAEVESGAIRMVVDNQIGVTVDSVAVTVYAYGGSVTLGTVTVPGPIDHGQSSEGTLPLNGRSIDNDWSVDLSFYTPGGVWLSSSDPKITVVADVPDPVSVTAGSGRIAALERTWNDTITITEQHQVGAATFSAGALRVNLTNSTALPLTVTWSTPGLAVGGTPIGATQAVAAGTSDEITLDLTGAAYAASGGDSRWAFVVSGGSPGSGDSIVTVSAADLISFDASISNVALSSLEAIVGPTELAFDSLTASIDWEDGLDQAGLVEGSLTIAIASEIGVPASFTGLIGNDRGDQIPVGGAIAPGAPGTPVTTDITVDQVAAMLNPLPRSLAFSGTAVYGDGVMRSTIGADDALTATLTLSAPPAVLIDGVAFESGPTSVELSSDDGSFAVDDRLSAGRLVVELSNHLPVGATLSVNFGVDSASAQTAPSLVLGPMVITAAEVDASGRSVAATASNVTVDISDRDMALFERDSVWIVETVTLAGPGSNPASTPARFETSDYVQWHAWLDLAVHVGGQR